ncbi:MAG: hypothetical protein PWP76_623 [Candidatus Diapherotrites archaeon]|nr:hypothetical protein [Candidatus Diapherotrites archaeon]
MMSVTILIGNSRFALQFWQGMSVRVEEIKGLMKSLGAKRSEILVYLALRRIGGPASISQILDSVNLSEKTVRNALDALMKRGLVVRRGRGRGTRYIAKGTRALMHRVKERIEEGVQEIFTHLRFRSS